MMQERHYLLNHLPLFIGLIYLLFFHVCIKYVTFRQLFLRYSVTLTSLFQLDKYLINSNKSLKIHLINSKTKILESQADQKVFVVEIRGGNQFKELKTILKKYELKQLYDKS